MFFQSKSAKALVQFNVLDLSLAHTYEEVVVVGAEDSLGNLYCLFGGQ